MLTFVSCFHEKIDETEVQINLEVSIDLAANPFIKKRVLMILDFVVVL